MGNPFRPIRGGVPPAIKVASDRFGKPLEPGQIVMFHPDVDLCFEVVDVRPVLNPSMPQGAMQITLQCAPFAFPVQPGGRDSRLVMVGLTAERQKAEAELAGSNGRGALHAADEPSVDDSDDPVRRRVEHQQEGGILDDGLPRTSGPDDGYRGQPRDRPAAPPRAGMATLCCPACNHTITSAFVKAGDPCDRCGDAKYVEAQ